MPVETVSEEGNIILELNSRTRVLEGKYNLLRDRVLVINQNMIEEYKKILLEIKEINSDIRDVQGEIFKIKETMKHIIKELNLFAKKEDVDALEKYIKIWDPMKFTTEKEVKDLIHAELEKKKEEKPKDGGKKVKRS